MQDKLVQMQEKLKTNVILEMNKKNDSVIDVWVCFDSKVDPQTKSTFQIEQPTV